MTAPSSRRPTAIISYSHTESAWAPEVMSERVAQVQRLVHALRTVGAVDADADFFHPNEDWTRWGPAQVTGCDFVLIIASPAWRDAWIGAGDQYRNKGLRAEADAVRSIEQAGRDELQKRVRIIMLPGSRDDDIPVGMHGIARHRVTGFELEDLEDLLRDLTDQPRFIKPSLGEVPVFPPEMTTHTPEIAHFQGGGAEIAGSRDTPRNPDPDERGERISQLRAQLAALPPPVLGEGPHLPWYRLRQEIASQLALELGQESASSPDHTSRASTSTAVVDWQPAPGLSITWVDTSPGGMQYGASALVIHLVPIPQKALPQRVLALLDETLPRILRSEKIVDDSIGLTRSPSGDGTLISAAPVQPRRDGVEMSRFLAVRTGRRGQVSIWFTLPRDRMGSVLDERVLKRDVKTALELGAEIVSASGPTVTRVGVAAELINTTSLTGGTIEELGTRTHASLPGAFSAPPRMDPDESVAMTDLRAESAWDVADAVTTVLTRAWRH